MSCIHQSTGCWSEWGPDRCSIVERPEGDESGHESWESQRPWLTVLRPFSCYLCLYILRVRTFCYHTCMSCIEEILCKMTSARVWEVLEFTIAQGFDWSWFSSVRFFRYPNISVLLWYKLHWRFHWNWCIESTLAMSIFFGTLNSLIF